MTIRSFEPPFGTPPTAFALALIACVQYAMAQAGPPAAAAPDLTGVYQAIPQGTTLPGGLKNSGGPGEIALQPAAAQQMKQVDLKEDAAVLCLPVGPFRMMARDRAKIEFSPGPAATLVMLFEDISHGHVRTIHLARPHPEKLELSWLGDSVGRWERDTLVIDTVGFNDRVWLNEKGAPHSEAFHLVERIRPVQGGKLLEYKVTAEDPKVLQRPYTYTRIYQKLETGIVDDFCEIDE
jgi:hypothetical protein